MINILIVDDSRQIAERLIPSVSSLPNVNRVFYGSDYNEGKKILETNPVDFAILDINLPGKSGIELLQLIRKDYNSIRIGVIMMTDEATEPRKQKCLSEGADYFIDKFTDFEQIPAIVNSFTATST